MNNILPFAHHALAYAMRQRAALGRAGRLLMRSLLAVMFSFLYAGVAWAVAPTVSITAPAGGSTYGSPAAITLTATAADSDGTVSQVQFFRGGTTLIGTATRVSGTSANGSYSFSWTGVATGTYSITAKATDNGGSVTTSTAVSVTVHTNVAPTTSVTTPSAGASFPAPASITLTANAADTDGGVSQVQFFRGGTTLIGTATRATGTAASGTYTYSWTGVAAGSYSITSKATDVNSSVTTSNAVSMTVTNALPTVSITAPVNGSTYPAGGSIALAATASDADGTISQVQFFRGGTTLIGTGTLSGGSYTFNWTSVAAGTYSITAKATDNTGAVTTSAAVSVTAAANVAPTVSVTSPAASSVFGSPAAITLTANAADSNGTVTQVQFFRGGSTLIGTAALSSGTSSSGAYVYNWTGVTNGTYSITAKATDNSGATTTSSAVSVQVHTNVAPAATMTSPADGSTYLNPASITLTANATDSDGGVTQLQFVDVNNNNAVIGTATRTSGTPANGTYSYTWLNPSTSLIIAAKATDVNGATGVSSAISINVQSNSPHIVILAPPANQNYLTSASSVTVPITLNYWSDIGTITQVEYYVDGTLIGTTPDQSGFNVVNWTATVAGAHSLTAKATNSGGYSTTSASIPITITFDQLPTVSVASTNGTSFIAGANGYIPLIALTATAADPDGTLDRIEFYANSSYLGVVNNPVPNTAVTFNWTNVLGEPSYVVGTTHNVTAIAYDNLGLSTTSALLPIRAVQHSSPALSQLVFTTTRAGPNGATVHLSANVADIDGTIGQVQFSYVDGNNNTVLIGNGTLSTGTNKSGTWTSTWNSVPAGFYSVMVTATNDIGFSSSGYIYSILVQNAQPASIQWNGPADGSSYTAYQGGATIPMYFHVNPCCADNGIAKIEVLQGSTVLTTLINPSVNNEINFNWTHVTGGSYVVTVKVTDAAGLVTTSTPLHLTVVDDPGPVVNITGPATGSSFLAGPSGASITLSATAMDVDDGVAQVNFYRGGTLIGPATLSSGSTAANATSTWSLNWTGVATGSYTVTAQAIDTMGMPSTSSPVVINVTGDQAPTITLNNPSGNLTPGAQITLTANAGDVDGTVTQVSFYYGASVVAVGTLISGTGASGVWSGTWHDMAAGTYVLTAKATDDLGLVTTSASVTVTIGLPNSNPQAGMYFIGTDHLNTPRLVENQSQQAVWTWSQDEPFGDSVPNGASSSGSFVFNLAFPGQYRDQETNTNYNYFRDYDPAIGRYPQSDPIGLLGGINTYSYVEADPLKQRDALGLNPGNPGFAWSHLDAWKNYPTAPCDCPTPPKMPEPQACLKDNNLLDSNIRDAEKHHGFIWFYKKVRNSGPWDYKQQGKEYEDFGNFNYGATGAATGFNSGTLERGAGAAQWFAGTSSKEFGSPLGGYPYGDDPNDQYWIRQGIKYFKCNCGKR